MNLQALISSIDSQLLFTVVSAVLFFVILWLIIVSVKLRTLQKKYATYMVNTDGKSMEMAIDDFMNNFHRQKESIETLEKQLQELEEKNKSNLSRVGIVRFSAFPGVGSDLSFSIAMMDDNKNGFVLSSIYGREDSRVYAKPLINGNSNYRMSEEEKIAVSRANEG